MATQYALTPLETIPDPAKARDVAVARSQWRHNLQRALGEHYYQVGDLEVLAYTYDCVVGITPLLTLPSKQGKYCDPGFLDSELFQISVERDLPDLVDESSSSFSDNEEEVVSTSTKWVCCDACAKWRHLPEAVDLNSLPSEWYCSMNYWDPKRQSCEAIQEPYPENEEIVLPVMKKRPLAFEREEKRRRVCACTDV